MSLRSSVLLLVLLLSAPPAPGAAPRPLRLVCAGSVTQPGGRPVPGARVALEGVPGAAATADADGHFAFTHVVRDATATAPQRFVLRASHRGWNLALPSGETTLAIELRGAAAPGSGARLEVRANDAEVAKAVARALETPGEAVVALDARFTRQIGREDRSAPKLTALEVVTLAVPEPAPAPPPLAAAPPASAPPERPESLRLFPGAPEPGSPRPAPPPASATVSTPPPGEPARDTVAARMPSPPPPAPAPRAPAPSAPAPSVAGPTPVLVSVPAPRPAVADTALRPGIRVSVRPETPAAASPDTPPAPGASPLRVVLGRAVPAAPAPPSGTPECRCRVNGTVEVRTERPVRGRPRVVVSLAGLPAARDTVALFMGPPRPFDLGHVPCGRYELEVRPLAARLARAEPDSTGFTCVAGGLRQFRVVLEPR
jgi:hypothetical protein